MERPLSSDELMDMLAKREQEDMTPAEREAVRNMPLPVSKPSAEEIAAMKEARRQEYRDNRQRVIKHLKKRGLRPAAIAGIVGNIDVETGGSFDFQQRQTKSGDPRDPNTVEGGGYGLFQFDDPRSGPGHETWYQQYLEKTNKVDSTESQLDYFLDMINAGEDTQDPFYEFSSNLGARNAGTIKAYFEVNENPEEISDAITDRFENPGIQHSDRRRASARETFAELQPTDRADVDPENQNINQAAPIADVGDDVPSPENKSEKGFLETIKPFVPIYRHLNEGGMAKQMELFEDGGLKDEGGTVDPVSGNEVPPGSTQEEVRDDIPAQLSEGEFVFPADVVRYIGLGNLMQMRQEAKLGLKLMEEMGQMGNSEEATIPDDLPFDINDLDIEDEPEYNVGGFVPGTQQQQQQFGISGFQQAAAPTTGVAQAPVQAASQQFVQPIVRPQQAAVPTMQQYKPADIPTFEQTIGQTPGQYDELRTYKNEAGMTMQIPFKNGQPIYPIPEGYKYVDPEKTKTEEVTTTPTTPQTTSVVEQPDPGKEDLDAARRQSLIDQYGNDTARIGLKDFFGKGQDQIYGVNYIGGLGFGPVGFGQVLSGNIPDDAKIMLKNGKDEIFLTGEEYKILSAEVKAPGTDYTKTREIIAGARKREAEEARKAIKFGEIRDAEGNIRRVSGEEERQDTAEKSARFRSAMKENNLVIDKETGAIKAKAGASEAEKAKAQQAILDYAASMATDDDEDDGPSGTSYSMSDIGSDQGNVSAPSDFDSSSSTGFEGYDDDFYNRGGFVEKRHSKTPEQQAAIAIAKKARGKKRGGLASKK